MTPSQALARWGRHDEGCPHYPTATSEVIRCVCGLDAELAHQAEWARLAEELIAEILAFGELWNEARPKIDAALILAQIHSFRYDGPLLNVEHLVTLARRLRGEGTG